MSLLQTKFNGNKSAYRKYMQEIGSKGGKAKVPTKGNGYVKVHGHKKPKERVATFKGIPLHTPEGKAAEKKYWNENPSL